ncbi:MAG TPA: hypothetical protein VH054_02135 [Polyangiaceae bacterium]|nr:hypothetical protein [Polyangiaceae bacterium]
MTIWRSPSSFFPCVLLMFAVGCGADDSASDSAAVSGNPKNINIGFGGFGTAPSNDFGQFGAMKTFFAATVTQPGDRICHLYLPWNIALVGPKDANFGERQDFEKWIADASNPCVDTLVSFKAKGTGESAKSPSDFHEVSGCTTCFGTAFEAFLDTFTPAWTTTAHPNRKFSFTAWNEPNNGGTAGNGTGSEMSPVTAGQYYLMARHLCGKHPSNCKVAAGDLGSNGNMIAHFQQNCASDVDNTLCAQASWLDGYKHFIAFHANDPAFELGDGFRPEYWAYHPWQVVNDYTAWLQSNGKQGSLCTDDANCSTMAFVHSLRGTWSGGHIWDTEIGAGQSSALGDEVQAKGAAYLLHIESSVTNRVWRIYYQGVEAGSWQIICGGKKRPSFKVLAQRETSYSGGPSTTCN